MILSKKNITTWTATILILAFALSSFALPAANGHTPPQTVKTYAFVSAAPNPAGIGQQVIIVFWLNWLPPTAQGTTGDRWRNLTLDITNPNGTIEHMGPFISDPVGSSFIIYTPTTVGTYNISFNFPGQVLSRTGPTGLVGPDNDYVNDTFTGSSANATLTVQQEPIPSWQQPPLPVSYWTRPIDAQNTNWFVLGSNWLGQSEFGATYLRYQRDGRAPNSPHVMWTKPLSFGGVVGGSNVGSDGMTFYSGTAYQFRFPNPIIMYGRLFYSLPLANAPTGGGYASVDLRTGEEYWEKDFGASVSGFGGLSANTPAFGQLYDFESPNQHGVNPNGYLWIAGTINGRGITNPNAAATPTNGSYTSAVTNATATVSASGWIAVDPMTGRLLFNETNVPTGTRFWGPQGEVLLMNVGRQNNNAPYTYMWQWNNTKLPGNDVAGGITQWLPGTTNWNMSKSYDWNVTLSQPLPPNNTAIIQVMPGDLVFGRSSALQFAGSTGGAFGTPDPYTLWAVNINATRGPIGQVMWLKNYTGSSDMTILIGPRDQETQMFTTYFKETMQWNGYSLLTGEQVWGPTAPEEAFNFYGGTTGLTAPYAIGYGHLYSTGYSGVTYCYDFRTGDTLFTYGNNASDPHNNTRTGETAYGAYPYQVAAVADGKVYIISSEHSLNAPPFKGAQTRCINATTGAEIWRLLSMCNWQEVAVADGYFVFLNYNDMRIYCVGPGPSAMSLSASQSVATVGGSVLITGSVTDQSANPDLKGTPAISDHDQGEWMEYTLMKNIAKPLVEGVPVRLTAVDPNNNIVDIGTVTSDSSGLFSTLWTPEIAGPYRITATFEGSGSYGPSSAEAAVGIAEAPQATNQPGGGTQQTDNTMILYIAAAGLVLAIIAIIAAIALRRR